jgi:HEAT repeat protein
MQIAERSRRGRVFITIAVVAGLALLIGRRLGSAPTVFQTTYQGTNLQAWALDWRNNEGNPIARARALAAIRVLSSNNLPALARALDYDPEPRLRRIESLTPVPLRDWAYAQWLLKDPRNERAIAATVALWALGVEAAPAVPQITNLMANTNSVIRWRALTVLPLLGSNGLSCLLTLLADEKYPHPADVAKALAFVHYDPGTNDQAMVIPVLAQCARDPDFGLAASAAATLGKIGLRPDISVPALIVAMTNPEPHARWSAIYALSKFGTNATVAIPALTRAFEDRVRDVREGATNTLREIQKRDE